MIWYRHDRRSAYRRPTIVDGDLIRQAGDYPSPAVPYRPVRRTLGADRADVVGLARGPGGVGDLADTTRLAGDCERDRVCQPHRDCVGVPAARLPAVQDGAWLLCFVGEGRAHRGDPRRVAGQGSPGGRPGRRAHRGDPGRADSQDLGQRAGTLPRNRRGQLSGASVIPGRRTPPWWEGGPARDNYRFSRKARRPSVGR